MAGRRRGRRGRRRAAGRRAGGAADRPRRRAAAAEGAVPRDRGVGPAPAGRPRRRGRGRASPGWPGSSRSTSTGSTAAVRWHRGRCLSYGDGVAFWALAEAVRARLGLVEADTGDVVRRAARRGAERVRHRPERARVAAAPARGARSASTAAAAFAARRPVRGVDDVPRAARADGRDRRAGAGRLQHADDGLLDFLDHLLGTGAGPDLRAGPGPAGAAGAPARRSGGRRTTVVRLGPLDDAAMAALVDGLVVGLPAAPGPPWSPGPRASRCSPSRRCGH